jgi:hypothetical protein
VSDEPNESERKTGKEERWSNAIWILSFFVNVRLISKRFPKMTGRGKFRTEH